MKHTYTPRQQMMYKPCGCDSTDNKPPGWLLDKIANEKLTGGYNTRKSNKCDTCNTFKSVNGTCMCL